jgi:hypothetical protein
MKRTPDCARYFLSIREANMADAAKLLRSFIGVLVLCLFVVSAVEAAVDEPFRMVDGLEIYLGVMPAAVLRAHPEPHHERKMHGGAPAGRDEYHILVAVFDQASGARIVDAMVEAEVAPLGLAGTRKTLEAMAVAGTVTYGNFFGLPRGDLYRIRLKITRHGSRQPVAVEFSYDLRGP